MSALRDSMLGSYWDFDGALQAGSWHVWAESEALRRDHRYLQERVALHGDDPVFTIIGPVRQLKTRR